MDVDLEIEKTRSLYPEEAYLACCDHRAGPTITKCRVRRVVRRNVKFLVMAVLLLSISAYGMEAVDPAQLRQNQGEPGSISFGRNGGVIRPMPNMPIEQLCPPESDPDFIQPDTLRNPVLRDMDSVFEVFDRRASAFAGYYQVALRSTPCIQGAIVLSFTVSADGRPSNVSYRAENPGIELIAKDVVSEVTRMNFGQASGEETFDWPLNFFNRSW